MGLGLMLGQDWARLEANTTVPVHPAVTHEGLSRGKSGSCKERGCHQEEGEEGEVVTSADCLLVLGLCDTSVAAPASCLPYNQHRATVVGASPNPHPASQSTGWGTAMLVDSRMAARSMAGSLPTAPPSPAEPRTFAGLPENTQRGDILQTGT